MDRRELAVRSQKESAGINSAKNPASAYHYQRYETSNEDFSTFHAALDALAFIVIGYGSFVLLAMAGVW